MTDLKDFHIDCMADNDEGFCDCGLEAIVLEREQAIRAEERAKMVAILEGLKPKGDIDPLEYAYQLRERIEAAIDSLKEENNG